MRKKCFDALLVLTFLSISYTPCFAEMPSEDEARSEMFFITASKALYNSAEGKVREWEGLGRAALLDEFPLNLGADATDENVAEVLFAQGHSIATMVIDATYSLNGSAIVGAFMAGDAVLAFQIFSEELKKNRAALVKMLGLTIHENDSWDDFERTITFNFLRLSPKEGNNMSMKEIGATYLEKRRRDKIRAYKLPENAPWEEIFRALWADNLNLQQKGATWIKIYEAYRAHHR